ncbi:GNAT family N-acetyltransferase [Leptobacterium flavescens]|uniref:GNAT family N-acetyltransferase n=1 Tax=Leptobacterium flavescens TaxID=472055 RepID=A0A6P0UV91_9FLAO|nr:GNAT family N-acetyltransferase [Leptobacterium flavescens]NER14733.1 GNAT family N-acetyltransferase [Leptobacterium flavescens]
MIEIKKYPMLSPETKKELRGHIDREFGHIPIVRETEWATPHWSIICYEEGEIASFYNIVEREIFVDNNKLKIAGINNVITPPAFRGKGLSSKTLKETEDFIFKDLACRLGVLLCADQLLPFYERLNWYKVDCPVYFLQGTERKLWNANTMLLSRNTHMSPLKIDLNGLPW